MSEVKLMQWIPLTADNVPDSEVLAANFKKGSFGYKEKLIGFISTDPGYDYYECESDNDLLQDVTHFIDLSQFDIIIDQLNK